MTRKMHDHTEDNDDWLDEIDEELDDDDDFLDDVYDDFEEDMVEVKK